MSDAEEVGDRTLREYRFGPGVSALPMYADELIAPWRESLPPVDVFDCHTHVGTNDPSGFSVTMEQLTGSLELARARAAVFPLKEPEGYADANLRVAEAAARSDGQLVAFCRIDPADEPVARTREALDAGARGIKLHPDGEEFDIGDRRLDEVFAIADAERLPMMVHAGPELDGIGETALARCARFPGARVILAHGALTDLAWIWREVEEHPNLFFDTSWWGPVHTMALFALIPPGRILTASDIPYCSPLSGTLTTQRCAIQAGLSDEQIALVLGGQFQRLLDGEEPVDAGPPPAGAQAPVDPLLERAYVTLLTALEPMQRGEAPENGLIVARHAAKVPDDHPDADVFRSISELLDLYDAHRDELDTGNQYAPGWDLIQAAAVLARTPAAPVPVAA